jgi:hypothetical protein
MRQCGFDNFFLTNITPVFFIETLADLEKQIHAGRTLEEVVGGLAYKTPDANSKCNVHHTTLLVGELSGAKTIDMKYGRPHVPGGKAVELGGRTGIIFQQSPEETALHRWQRGEFLQLERLQAKRWRANLSGIDLEQNYREFQRFFPLGKPKTLTDVKRFVDFYLSSPDQEAVLSFGLSVLGFPERGQQNVLSRWRSLGKSPVREFAPYLTHVLSVDLFFSLAIAADLIGRGRPSHKIDIAYLYYLPFCMVFVSNDKLHAAIAPLFLREDQSFVAGGELKPDLRKLDAYYDAFPDDVKERGVMSFAVFPPLDDTFLVTRLWDKHMSPKWRQASSRRKPLLDGATGKTIIEEIQSFEE